MQYYYFRSLEKVTSGLLDLFNSFYISQFKYDKPTSTWNKLYHRVPIEIATKEKILREYEQNENMNMPKRYVNVPRMSLMLNGITKFNEKQTNQINVIKNSRISETDDGKKILNFLRNPTWWKANYTLFILTKRMDDMSQLTEQILPMFQPQRALNIKLIPELDLCVSLDTNISQNVQFEIPEDLAFDQLRLINASIEINVPIPFFPPISDSKIINKIITRFAPVVGDYYPEITTITDMEEFQLVSSSIDSSIKVDADISGSWVATRSFNSRTLKVRSEMVETLT